MVLLTRDGEKLVDLCFKGSEVVLQSSGGLFAAIQFLECLEMCVRGCSCLVLGISYLGKVGILRVGLSVSVLLGRHVDGRF